MSCATTQFQVLSFYGTHAKYHGVKGLSKHYNLQLDPKCFLTQIHVTNLLLTAHTGLCKASPITVKSLNSPIKQHQLKNLIQCTR